jgi:hypothetical protein
VCLEGDTALNRDDLAKYQENLAAILRNLPTDEWVRYDPWVRWYHSCLFGLRRAGADVRGYWISGRDMLRLSDSTVRVVEGRLLRARLEGLLGCLVLQPHKRQIGFGAAEDGRSVPPPAPPSR